MLHGFDEKAFEVIVKQNAEALWSGPTVEGQFKAFVAARLENGKRRIVCEFPDLGFDTPDAARAHAQQFIDAVRLLSEK